ncbi:hypothetical protein KC354_g17586 [Hortaea werneckii]|nr:hypothetical protein KC354_g17586 [Hortaea werneckii]
MFPFHQHHRRRRHPLLALLLLLLLSSVLFSPFVQSLPITTTVITTKTLTTTAVPSAQPQQPQPSHQAQNDDNPDFLAYALVAADRLTDHWYNATTGLWQELWWNSGNFVTTLARFGQVVEERGNADADAGASKGWRDAAIEFLAREFGAASKVTDEDGQGWTKGFFDDGGWWALAWIQVYDLTNDSRYLTAAEEIFEDLATGLNATCGGQWWDKAHTASNTINNALYISVAAHLANRVPTTTTSSSKPPETYRAAAQTHLHWLRDQNLLTPNGTYVDGLDLQTCKPTGPVFTYNQGVMIGALVEMSRSPTVTAAAAAAAAISTSSGDHEEEEEEEEEEEGEEGASLLLDQAEAIATGTMRSMVDEEGILTETAFAPAFPNLDLVAAQFKGVFVRNLASLYSVRPREESREFLSRNARSVWEKDRIPGGVDEGLLGAAWQGPVESVSAAAQGSGLDCLVAAVGVGG